MRRVAKARPRDSYRRQVRGSEAGRVLIAKRGSPVQTTPVRVRFRPSSGVSSEAPSTHICHSYWGVDLNVDARRENRTFTESIAAGVGNHESHCGTRMKRVNRHTSWVLYRLTCFEIPLATGSRTARPYRRRGSPVCRRDRPFRRWSKRRRDFPSGEITLLRPTPDQGRGTGRAGGEWRCCPTRPRSRRSVGPRCGTWPGSWSRRLSRWRGTLRTTRSGCP